MEKLCVGGGEWMGGARFGLNRAVIQMLEIRGSLHDKERQPEEFRTAVQLTNVANRDPKLGRQGLLSDKTKPNSCGNLPEVKSYKQRHFKHDMVLYIY